MPTPHLADYLTRLRRDASTLIPCRHPECAAYRLNLAERIGIVVHLLKMAPHDSPGKRPQATDGTRDGKDILAEKGEVPCR